MGGSSESDFYIGYANAGVDIQNKSENIQMVAGSLHSSSTDHTRADGSVAYMGYKNDFDKFTVTASGSNAVELENNGDWVQRSCRVTAYY